MHLLVNKLKILNLSVRNHLIQKLDHHILCGFSSKDQLEHIIVKKIRILKLIQHIVLIKLNKSVKTDIKRDLIISLTELETQNYDKTNSGVFISRINKDANELSSFYNNVVDCLADIISNIGFIIYIGFLNIWVFLFIVVYVLTTFIVENKRIKLWFINRKRWKKADEKVVGTYSELVRGVRDVKV